MKEGEQVRWPLQEEMVVAQIRTATVQREKRGNYLDAKLGERGQRMSEEASLVSGQDGGRWHEVWPSGCHICPNKPLASRMDGLLGGLALFEN